MLCDDLCYETVSSVLESWQKGKTNNGFEEKVGMLALEKFFEKEPEAMKVFGFNGEENPSQTGLGRMGMLIHSMRMVQMFDTVMNLLGPDTDSLRDILQQLGKRHISYGVKANFFPHFGEALIESLAEVLADDWNDELERAWVEIYDQISGEIVHSILSQ